MQPTMCYIVGATFLLLRIASVESISCVHYDYDSANNVNLPMVIEDDREYCRLYVEYEYGNCSISVFTLDHSLPDDTHTPTEDGKCTEASTYKTNRHCIECRCTSGPYCAADIASFQEFLQSMVEEFENVGYPNHPKCLWNDFHAGIGDLCSRVIYRDMNDDIRLAIWAKHNEMRSNLAIGVVENGQSGTYLRKASKLYQLRYVCPLEMSAIERAKQCEDISNNEPPEDVSENYQVFTKNINRDLSIAAKQAVVVWFSEIQKLESPLDQISNLFYTHFGISSFAKIASDLTVGVGCAAIKCSTQINVVCHYDTTLANGMKLYAMGPYCNRCPGGIESCVNGLCPAY